jgi:hypothetical protein
MLPGTGTASRSRPTHTSPVTMKQLQYHSVHHYCITTRLVHWTPSSLLLDDRKVAKQRCVVRRWTNHHNEHTWLHDKSPLAVEYSQLLGYINHHFDCLLLPRCQLNLRECLERPVRRRHRRHLIAHVHLHSLRSCTRPCVSHVTTDGHGVSGPDHGGGSLPRSSIAYHEIGELERGVRKTVPWPANAAHHRAAPTIAALHNAAPRTKVPQD